jgi:hypothetical protein
MQEYDISMEETEGKAENIRLAQLRAYMRLIFKRLIVVVSFGPGILGVLWLIGRFLIKR